MLTVSLQLLLQPADLSGPGLLQQGLGLLGPGGDLEAGASSGVDHLTSTVHRELLVLIKTNIKAILLDRKYRLRNSTQTDITDIVLRNVFCC